MTSPTIKKETKNKIRVEFERTPLLERLKAKFINLYTVKKVSVQYPVLKRLPVSTDLAVEVHLGQQ